MLRFYNIRAFDLTPTSFEDDDNTESESLSESSSTLERFTLEEAVKANPAFALARLASRLGLDYHNIHQSMGIYEQIRTVKAELENQRTKREQSKDDDKNDDARPSKKTTITEALQICRSNIDIPFEALIACPDEFQSESPQSLSHVGWARPSPPLPLRTQASSSKDAGSTLSLLLGGLTIAFIHISSVVRDARKITPYGEETL